MEKRSLEITREEPGVDLPHRYDIDRIVLLVRDPRWIYAYWELRKETLKALRDELKEEFGTAKFVLRVYDTAQVIFDGNNAHGVFDVQIDEQAKSWYIALDSPGRSWCVDLGLFLASGRFITVLRSNTAETPPEAPLSYA